METEEFSSYVNAGRGLLPLSRGIFGVQVRCNPREIRARLDQTRWEKRRYAGDDFPAERGFARANQVTHLRRDVGHTRRAGGSGPCMEIGNSDVVA
jgi:hypothetical protein